jgi:hypothetical protein
VTEKRLAHRSAESKDVSDGRWEVFLEQKKKFEPLDEMPAASCLALNTDAPVDQLIRDCEKFLRTKIAWSRGSGTEIG